MAASTWAAAAAGCSTATSTVRSDGCAGAGDVPHREGGIVDMQAARNAGALQYTVSYPEVPECPARDGPRVSSARVLTAARGSRPAIDRLQTVPRGIGV